MICNPIFESRILILPKENRVKQTNKAQTGQKREVTVSPVNRQKRGGTLTGTTPNSTDINKEICRRISPYPPVNRTDPDQHFQTLKSAHNGPGNRSALRSLQHASFVLAIALTVVTHFTNDYLARFFQPVVGD